MQQCGHVSRPLARLAPDVRPTAGEHGVNKLFGALVLCALMAAQESKHKAVIAPQCPCVKFLALAQLV